MERKLQNINLTYYNLLIALGLSQAWCQTLAIIPLKEFIKLKYGHRHQKRETCRIKYKYNHCLLSCQQKFDETLKEYFVNTYKPFNHDNNKFILLFILLFITMIIWMIGKNSMKHCYLKKNILKVNKYGKHY